MERQRHPFSSPATLTEAVAREYPGAEIAVSFPDKWQLVHRFKRLNTLRYVAGFPPSQEHARGDHFFGLPREINQSLTTYRLYKLFEPKPVYQFEVSWNSRIGKGRIIGGSELCIHLQPVGQAQIWKGETYGVLWEAFLFSNQRERQNWHEELATFWQAVENDMGVRKIFTEPREPTFEEGYTEFLSSLGYAPDPDFDWWWSKELF
jgi:hypothetical protein